jgi:hypothetical protein
MKNKILVSILMVLAAVSCENKIDLSTEKFDKTKFKETIEQVFADSPNKENKEILLSYINTNIEGKIPTEYDEFNIKGQLDIPNFIITYGDILNKYAKPYENFKKKVNGIIDIKLIKFTKPKGDLKLSDIEIEIQNKGDIDIVEVIFGFDIFNKSGERIFFETDIMSSIKLPKGSKTKIVFSDNEFEKLFNMDINTLTAVFSVSKLSFQDGSTLKLPS